MLSFYIHQQQLKANHEERYNEGQSKNTETFVITFLLYIILPNDLAIIFKQFEKKKLNVFFMSKNYLNFKTTEMRSRHRHTLV